MANNCILVQKRKSLENIFPSSRIIIPDIKSHHIHSQFLMQLKFKFIKFSQISNTLNILNYSNNLRLNQLLHSVALRPASV